MMNGTCVGLRAIERSDLSILLEWRNKPEYRKYFREYKELSSENQSNWYEKVVLNDRNTIMFTIEELTTKRLLGACGLCYIDWVNRSADFSIYIGADNLYIDAKYADDAAFIMMRYGFEELGLHRLWSEIYDYDHQKIKFFERLGFSRDGVHREAHWSEGRWWSSIYYSILDREWAK